MTRRIALLLALLLALTLGCGPTAGAVPPVVEAAHAAPAAEAPRAVTEAPPAAAVPAPLAPAPRAESAPAFSGAAAHQHVAALAEMVGSRPAGSPSQVRAQQYLLEQFRALGYLADLQPFTITFYDDRGSTVTVAGPLGQPIAANTLQYSAAGTVEAEVVDAGLGRPEEYEAAGVQGKIALVARGEIRFAEKVDAAARAGARAVIVSNNQPGNFNGSLVGLSAIPAVSVSEADGQALRQALQGGPVTARVEVDASMEQRTAANVVATRPGGPRTLVIGGHFDSVAAGPGANDNASGTAVVVELARVMAARPTPYTLQFVAFDAEEIGLNGSAHFVSQLTEPRRQAIAAMINLDMVGVGDTTRVGGSEELRKLAQTAGTQMGLDVSTLEENGGSDHASFLRAGIPALFVHRTNDPNYHSPNDRAEYVDPANLEIAGRLVLDVVAALERAE